MTICTSELDEVKPKNDRIQIITVMQAKSHLASSYNTFFFAICKAYQSKAPILCLRQRHVISSHCITPRHRCIPQDDLGQNSSDNKDFSPRSQIQ